MKKEQPSRNQHEEVEYDNIKYLFNTKENTAGIIGIKGNLQNIFFTGSIKHESKEYYVTSILFNAFKNSKIEQIQFSSDLKLQTIDKNAFFESQIKSIKIPSSVTSIGENAFFYANNLN